MTAKVAAAEKTQEQFTPSIHTITKLKKAAQRAKERVSLSRQLSQRIVARREASERTKVLKAKEKTKKAAIDASGGVIADVDDVYFSTLKLEWPSLLLHVLMAYAAIMTVAVLVNLLCANGLDFDGTGTGGRRSCTPPPTSSRWGSARLVFRPKALTSSASHRWL
jgi:hypothetical protein